MGRWVPYLIGMKDVCLILQSVISKKVVGKVILAIKGGSEVADVEVVGQPEKERDRGMVTFWYLGMGFPIQTMV